MANKVITISGNTNKSNQISNNEVYRDISMVAERKNKQYLCLDNEGKPTLRQRQTFTAAKDVNVKAIFNSLRNIFSWIPGERILNPDFGSKLYYYLYEGITDTNVEQIIAEIKGICVKWEPRVNITNIVNVSDINDTEDNTVRLDIKFTIPSLSNEQYTYSYVYNRTE